MDPGLFDTPPEQDFDRLTSLVTLVTGAPVSLLSLVDESRQFFKSACGLPEPWATGRGTPLSHSFCKHVVASGEALVVEDATVHPVVRDNPAIRDLGVVAYLGEPVRDPWGEVIGAFCAIDHAPRRWSARDRELLSTLAGSVEQILRLRAADAAQRAAMTDLIHINEKLSQQSEELATARHMAEDTLSRQTRFLAGLSHELRTPLTGVLGGLSLLDVARDEEARARCAGMIRASAGALSEAVEDLLTYCRLGAGIETASPAPFDPRAEARRAVEAVRAQAEAKGLDLDLDVAPDTPESFVSDGGLIERTLVNLLGNAIKYTDSGAVRLSLSVAGGALELRVRDTGRGVPEDRHAAIFEPFDRGDGETTRGVGGTGLGLAIARETARRIGGELTLERSAPGAGSTFLLRAPAAGAKAAARDAA